MSWLVAVAIVGQVVASEIAYRPLASPSAVEGEPPLMRFTRLFPEWTSLTEINRFDDPAMWRERYIEFNNGPVGTGVAMADFDGDGRTDVYVANKISSGNLYLNIGDFRFSDVTEKAGLVDESGEWKSGVAIADVDNDGDIDLLVCRIGVPNLFYVNQGDGTFRESARKCGLEGVHGSAGAAFGDFDRDGWIDCYLLTNVSDARARADGDRDLLLRNRGDGTFEDVSDSAGISGVARGHSATWWDYDEDGWLDLYVANDFAPRDLLYHNNGDGTFSDRIDMLAPAFPFSSMGADIGDVDGDGHLDLYVADMAATSQEKDRRGMADTRINARSTSFGSSEAVQTRRNVLLLGGASRFREAAWMAGLAATDWTWSVRWVDLDNDGRLDLHVTNGMNREQHNVDLLSAMMSARRPDQRVQALASSPVFSEPNLAFRQVGPLAFESVGAAWNLDEKGVSFGAAWGDLDDDGDLDVVYANMDGPPTVLRNDGKEGHRLLVKLVGRKSNRLGFGAVVDATLADGRVLRRTLQSARGYGSSSDPRIHFGLGDATQVERLRVIWPSGVVQDVVDVPAGRLATIVEAEGSSNSGEHRKSAWRELSVEMGLSLSVPAEEPDPTVPQALLPTTLHNRGPRLLLADFEDDGVSEVVLGGGFEAPLRMMRKEGNGWSVRELDTRPPFDVVDGPLAILDLDGDGDRDLLVTRGGANWPEGSSHYQPVWLRQDEGDWTLGALGVLPSWPVSAGATVVADFDGDGWEEVFLGGRVLPGRYPYAPDSAWWEQSSAGMVDRSEALPSELREVGMVTAALAADLWGDGRSELIVATEWGAVTCWQNQQGSWVNISKDVGLDERLGWWSSLAVADLNADGVLDVVAGNAGLNTPYAGSIEGEGGSRLLAEEGRDGRLSLVEARWENGEWYPRATLRQVARVWPEVARRFRSSDAFARAPLQAVWPADQRSGWWDRTITELRSGVWLSDAAGKRQFAALPRIVQIAPAQSLVVRDFDGDGVLDVFIAQNSQMPVASVGNFDGGLGQLLRGTGFGNAWSLEPVAPNESGLMVPGQTVSALWWSADESSEDGLLFVSRINEPMLVFGRHVESVVQGAGPM